MLYDIKGGPPAAAVLSGARRSIPEFVAARSIGFFLVASASRTARFRVGAVPRPTGQSAIVDKEQ